MTAPAQALLRVAAVLVAATFLVCAGVVLYRPGATEREWIRIQRAYLDARGSRAPARVREISVAWACAPDAAGDCAPTTAVERCTTCHVGIDADLGGVDPTRLPAAARPHPDRATWLGTHRVATFGCLACHGGDGVALERAAAHRGLARLGRTPGEVPEIEARCAACHPGPLQPAAPSPARAAWARFRAAVHRPVGPEPAAVDPIAKPAPTLAEGRSLFRSLRCGACHASTEPVEIATPLRILGVRSSHAELEAGLRAHGARTGVPLPEDPATISSLAAHLAEVAQPDIGTAVLHRASLAGSSANEGRVLFERLACGACHAPSGALALTGVDKTRTADWVAYYLTDPARANPAARMPSMRITPREAASLATYLLGGAREAPVRANDHSSVSCPTPEGPRSMPRAACGEALTKAMRCESCHAPAPPKTPHGPSLLTYGDSLDGPAALAKLDAHGAGAKTDAPRYSLSDAQRRALATFLVSERDTRVLSNFIPRGGLWDGAPGAELYAELDCGGCHADDEAKDSPRGPSLFGEGLRTRPQWLFGLLRDPGRHMVRPAFHPEWAYRDLVPPDHVSSRMPAYRLTEREMTELVHFFTTRDGASYPYATTTAPVLSAEAQAAAIGDLSREDRGACLTCHTVGVPDVERARAGVDKLAAPLSLAHTRLRPEWIDACILQPEVWIGPRMPALFHDPFGPPLPWAAGAVSEPPRHALDQVDRLRDLVLLLRERTILPPPGSEGRSPALGLGEL